MRDLPDPTPDTPSLAGLRARLEQLTPQTERSWGTMTPAQMARHCRIFIELCQGEVRVSLPMRWLAGTLGPIFLRKLLRGSPRHGPRGLRTLGPLRADPAVTLDLDEERARLAAALDTAAAWQGTHDHPLYGRMRAVDVQAIVRHHTAHHLHQFGLLDAS